MSMHASTILTRSPVEILSHISRLSRVYSDQSLLFALSHNVHRRELEKLVKSLTSFSSQTIGCLSAPLPEPSSRDFISCSLAVFPSNQSILFRSTIPGRADPQVGRWHAFRKKDDMQAASPELPDGPIDWGDVWDRNAGDNALPAQLQSLNINDIHRIIYFSDRAPEGLSNSLAAFRHATKLGLVAASTPFVTGRPVTLFHNQDIYDSGAVGIALKHEPTATGNARAEFLGIVPLSPPMTVTRCEGNMINSLDNSNPTKLLLAAIRKNEMEIETSGSFKVKDKFSLGTVRNGTLCQIYNITAGDPSRGNISLETQTAPSMGTLVQYFYRPSSTLEIPNRFFSSSPRTVGFLQSTVSPYLGDAVSDRSTNSVGDGTTRVLSDTFLASSENGFLMGRPAAEAEPAWTCTVPGGLASLEWSKT